MNWTPKFATAAATIVIAAFTIVLAAVGGLQAWLTRRTINLARDEFDAAHRPKITVHAVETLLDATKNKEDPWIGARIVYFNKGRAPAKIVEIKASITNRRSPPESGFTVDAFDLLPVPVDKLDAGQRGYFELKSTYSLIFQQRRETLGAGRIYCLGRITYEDRGGRRRETGFFRAFEAPRERWIKTDDNSEYDYTY